LGTRSVVKFHNANILHRKLRIVGSTPDFHGLRAKHPALLFRLIFNRIQLDTKMLAVPKDCSRMVLCKDDINAILM
jgi:hypothetical protein